MPALRRSHAPQLPTQSPHPLDQTQTHQRLDVKPSCRSVGAAPSRDADMPLKWGRKLDLFVFSPCAAVPPRRRKPMADRIRHRNAHSGRSVYAAGAYCVRYHGAGSETGNLGPWGPFRAVRDLFRRCDQKLPIDAYLRLGRALSARLKVVRRPECEEKRPSVHAQQSWRIGLVWRIRIQSSSEICVDACMKNRIGFCSLE